MFQHGMYSDIESLFKIIIFVLIDLLQKNFTLFFSLKKIYIIQSFVFFRLTSGDLISKEANSYWQKAEIWASSAFGIKSFLKCKHNLKFSIPLSYCLRIQKQQPKINFERPNIGSLSLVCTDSQS